MIESNHSRDMLRRAILSLGTEAANSFTPRSPFKRRPGRLDSRQLRRRRSLPCADASFAASQQSIFGADYGRSRAQRTVSAFSFRYPSEPLVSQRTDAVDRDITHIWSALTCQRFQSRRAKRREATALKAVVSCNDVFLSASWGQSERRTICRVSRRLYLMMRLRRSVTKRLNEASDLWRQDVTSISPPLPSKLCAPSSVPWKPEHCSRRLTRKTLVDR